MVKICILNELLQKINFRVVIECWDYNDIYQFVFFYDFQILFDDFYD